MKGKDKNEESSEQFIQVTNTRVMLTLEPHNHRFNKVGKDLKDH